MDGLKGRLAELVGRLDALREHSLTKLADALSRANLTADDVAEYVKESPRNYNRSLVVRRDGYELLILTWKPGQGMRHQRSLSVKPASRMMPRCVPGFKSWLPCTGTTVLRPVAACR